MGNAGLLDYFILNMADIRMQLEVEHKRDFDTHANTHARTRARTHAHTHTYTHTHIELNWIEIYFNNNNYYYILNPVHTIQIVEKG